MTRRREAALAGAALTLVARAALGAPEGVSITVDPCADVPAPFVERVVAAELAGEGQATTVDVPPTDVRVTCQDGLVVVTVSTRGRESMVRTIDLEREAPPARPRVLSVAIAELVAASRALPGPVATVPAPPPPPSPPPPLIEPPRSLPRARAWTVGVGAVARGFSTVTTFGAGLSVRYLSRAHLGLRLDADAADGRVRVDLGSVDARVGSVGVRAMAGGAWRTLVFEAGLGVRGGIASLRGDPDAGVVGHTLTGAWGGPFVATGGTWAWAPSWSIVAVVEGGVVTQRTAGLVASDPTVKIEGPWWSAGLGLAWSP